MKVPLINGPWDGGEVIVPDHAPPGWQYFIDDAEYELVIEKLTLTQGPRLIYKKETA